MKLEEVKKLCSDLLALWFTKELRGDDISQHDDNMITGMLVPSILLNKFKNFNIDIVLPDELLLILTICTDDNPGQSQVILKDLLNHIKGKKGLIPSGYVINVFDFGECFPMEFPITSIKEINDKYYKLWNEQKKTRIDEYDSDNLCDTPKWWKEVMQ